MKPLPILSGLAILLLLASTAPATTVNVAIQGTVEYNQVSIGQFGAVMPGDAVQVSFTVDSDVFSDDTTFPTRGYPIDEASFVLTAGPATVHLQSPFPGTPYFVLRNNDPAVDGFFFSKGLQIPTGLDLDEPANGAGTRFFQSAYSVSYDGDTLASLDILDAVGMYDYTGIGSFYFVIVDLGFEPIGFIYEGMQITGPVGVEETSWGGVKALYR